MKNSFKIILLFILLFAGFFAFKTLNDRANVNKEAEIIHDKDDEIDNKIEGEKIDNVLPEKVAEVQKTAFKDDAIDKIAILNDDDLYLGNKDSKVVMVEYDSLTCPHCKDFYQNIFPTLKAEYIDTNKILYITRPFPFDGISFKLALMIECLKKPEDKLKLRDLAFKNQNIIFDKLQSLNFSDKSEENKKKNEAEIKKVFDEFLNIFEMAGLDRKHLEQCGDPDSSKDLSKSLLEKTELAYKSKYKIEATPTFIINGKKYDGTQTLKYWKDILNSELNNATGSSNEANKDSLDKLVTKTEYSVVKNDEGANVDSVIENKEGVVDPNDEGARSSQLSNDDKTNDDLDKIDEQNKQS